MQRENMYLQNFYNCQIGKQQDIIEAPTCPHKRATPKKSQVAHLGKHAERKHAPSKNVQIAKLAKTTRYH